MLKKDVCKDQYSYFEWMPYSKFCKGCSLARISAIAKVTDHHTTKSTLLQFVMQLMPNFNLFVFVLLFCWLEVHEGNNACFE